LQRYCKKKCVLKANWARYDRRHAEERREKALFATRKRRAKRRSCGVCTECGEELSGNSVRYCEHHFFMDQVYGGSI
jgi:hypothetical protein